MLNITLTQKREPINMEDQNKAIPKVYTVSKVPMF